MQLKGKRNMLACLLVAALLLDITHVTAAARPISQDTSTVAAARHVGSSRALKQSENAVRNRVRFNAGDEDYLFTIFLGQVDVAEAGPFVAAAGAAVSCQL